jgi:hypothetical protein
MQSAKNFKIVLQESLRSEYLAWFEGLEIETQPDGSTCLTGSLPDQAALHGVLERIRDLNLTLVSVQTINKE